MLWCSGTGTVGLGYAELCDCYCECAVTGSGGARILEQAGPAAGPKVLW